MHWGRLTAVAAIVGSLAACSSGPDLHPTNGNGALPPPIEREHSRWTPVQWSELPGWGQDRLHEAWNAWVKGCQRPAVGQEKLCGEARQMVLASEAEKHAWLEQRLQPYRLDEPSGNTPSGLLTGYYEPILSASRLPSASHRTPLYAPPASLARGSSWYTRQEMDTSPAVQAELKGRAIAWLADPIDAMILQIQGSGRLNVVEPDGRQKQVRLAFAAHNGQPYRSVGRWLLDQRAIRDASWEGIKEWAVRNPARVNEMLWSNPRTVFFKEEPLTGPDAQLGPKGAQGVPLTPGRSIAVDPKSIPYGTPVWLVTRGAALNAQKLVMAQDTGGAIVGAARADLFTGWGSWTDPAYLLASKLKQPLGLWALWPRR